VQLREDSYSPSDSFPWRNIEEINMDDWEFYKRSVLPRDIEIYGIENRYELSATPSAREYTVTAYPPEPANESISWRCLFSPEQLLLNKAMMVNWEDASTGEYIRYANLYEEKFSALDGGHLTKTWYEPNFMLPVKRLSFAGRPDSSQRLTNIYLAEYDFEPSKELFDPQSSPFVRAGFSHRTFVMEGGRCWRCEVLDSVELSGELGKTEGLYWAARRGQTNLAETLLKHDADPNASIEGGLTPLDAAVCRGSVDMVRLLLEHGADPNASIEEGLTPLAAAACRGSIDMVRLLLEYGAYPNSKTADQWTPLKHAIEQNHSEVARLLKEAGAVE
jgi:hypothetical protein